MSLNLAEQGHKEELEALGRRVVDACKNRRLDAELRKRLSDELASLDLKSVLIFPGSLAEDPEHASNFYIAADLYTAGKADPSLVHFAPRAAVTRARFRLAVRTSLVKGDKGGGIAIDLLPFSSRDHHNVREFAEQIDSAFLPRPQRALPAVAAGNRHPEISLPAAFEAYQSILDTTHVNMASTVQLSANREMTTDDALKARNGEDPTATGHTRVSIRHLYHAGLWSAIRPGWREGYTAEADHFIVSGNSREQIGRSVESVKEAIRHASGYTKFTTDTSRLFELQSDPRHPQAWSELECRRKVSATVFGWRAALDSGRIPTNLPDRRQTLRLPARRGHSSGGEIWRKLEAQ